MGWFRLNSLSVGSLTTTVLLGVITFYLLSLKDKGRETWYLAGYLGTLFVLLFAYTARYSIFSPSALIAGQLANLIVFGVACLVQFAYWFGGNPYRLESKIVLGVTLAASAWAWGSLFVPGRFPALYDFDAAYFTYDFGPRISVLSFVEYLWAFVVFLRRTGNLIRPRGRVAASHRSFALLTLATLPIAAQYVLFQTGVMERATYAIVFNTGSLLICLFIFIVYVNNAPHPTSFIGKLVGIPLAVLMVAFGIASNAMLPVVEKTVLDRYRAETQVADAALVTQNLGRLPRDVAFIVPTTSDLVKLRYGKPSVYRPTDLLRRVLGRGDSSAAGAIGPRYHYTELRDTSTYYLTFPLYYEMEEYSVGFSYAAYRLEIHRFAWRLAAVVLVACVVVVFGFPVFFRRGLLRPLRSLLAAVGRVSQGNFRETFEAPAEDEIGELADGYNRMITSLASMEGNFKTLTENAYDAILIASTDGDILYANARAGELVGRPVSALQGSRLVELLPVDGAPGSYETHVRRADGEARPVEVAAARTTWQGMPATAIIVRDVSERKRTEELVRSQQLALMRSDKLASLGELVAGLAHEVNNPNHVVSMNVGFLEAGLPSLFSLAESSDELSAELHLAGKPYEAFKGSALAAVADIKRSAERIDHIVGQLKRFIRGSSPERRPVEINEVVRSVVDLSRDLIDESTTDFNLDLTSDHIEVVGDFVELEQVVLNLIENACQALGVGDGAISVSTRKDSSEARILVQDNGQGIPEENLPHVADPFFTTRGAQGGSGLGLSIVKRLVHNHGGELSVESTQGRGTSITVRLPLSRGNQGGD